PERIARSTTMKNAARTAAITKTMSVVITTSRRVGQITLAISARVCWTNWSGLVRAIGRKPLYLTGLTYGTGTGNSRLNEIGKHVGITSVLRRFHSGFPGDFRCRAALTTLASV